MTSNVAILLDLNSLASISVPGVEPETSSSSDVHPIDQSSEPSISFSQLCDYILLLLSKDCKGRNKQFDPSKLNWTFKFFLSNDKSHFPSVGRRLLPLHKETFEQLELQLRQQLAAHKTKSAPETNKVIHLVTALKDITADIPWDDPEEKAGVENKVFIFTNVPGTESEFVDFSGDRSLLADYKLLIKAVIPKEYYKKFHMEFKIQLNFVDIGMKSECPEVLHKLAAHFQAGKVIPFSPIMDTLLPPEYPSYCSLLRKALIVHAPKISPPSLSTKGIRRFNNSNSFSIADDISRRSSRLPRDRDNLNLTHPVPVGYNQDYQNLPGDSDRDSVMSAMERANFSRRMDALVHQGKKDIAEPIEKVEFYLDRMAPPKLRERPVDYYYPAPQRPKRSTREFSRSRAMILELQNQESRRRMRELAAQKKREEEQLAVAERGIDADLEADESDTSSSYSDSEYQTMSVVSEQPKVMSAQKMGKSSEPHRNFMLKNESFISAFNPKRPLLVSKRLPKRRELRSRRGTQKSATGSRKSPKRVRRNLFSARKTDALEGIKSFNTLSAAATQSHFSPYALKSPASRRSAKSPRSAYRQTRTKRRLNLDEPPNAAAVFQSPNPNSFSEVICPETPTTPKDQTGRKRGRYYNSDDPGSAQKVIEESPESSSRAHFSRRRLQRKGVDSISFYSNHSDSQKSRAWERSGNKLMAARIKDSVDFKSSLSINDIEFISNESLHPIDSPYKRPTKKPISSSTFSGSGSSPLPGCSKAMNENNQPNFEVTTQSDINPSIEALIRSNNFPPLKVNKVTPMMSAENNSNIVSTEPPKEEKELPKEPSFHMPPPPVPVTPSKRVQFSLICSTPSPLRSPMTAKNCSTPTTPGKSILKDIS